MYVSMPQHPETEHGNINHYGILWSGSEREDTPEGLVFVPVSRTDHVAAFTKREAETAFHRQYDMLKRTGNILGMLVEDVFLVDERRAILEDKYSEYEGYDLS